MLNLTEPVQYTSDEEDYINKLSKKDGKEWDKRTESNIKLKDRIRQYMKEQQEDKCAYCGFPLYVTAAPEIEHIAPKSKHPEFMYEPYNLVLACRRCNSPALKGFKDTIEVKNVKYVKCTFTIIHPYFDNPDMFLHTTEDGMVCKNEGLTKIEDKKATNTIEMFDLNCSARRYERKRNIDEKTFEREMGISLSVFVKDISSYKPLGLYKKL